MPNNDHLWVFAFLTAVTGAGIFVRVLAKEKHRREKHLKLRLEAKMKQMEEEERQKYPPSHAQPPVGVTLAENGVPVLADIRPA